jgi:S1-C subfamily serine protease
MFADAVAKVLASIFPIFFTYERDGRRTLSVSGTGFFVDDSGLFVTADHIMNCAPAASTYYYYGNLPDHLSQPALEIEMVARDPGRDLYLGRVARDHTRAVELSREAVRPGESVCLGGYPMAEVSINPNGGIVANVRRYWQPTYVLDVTRAVVDSRVYDGYLVGHPCFSGISGGPVFDLEGKVRGMAVATFTRAMPDESGGQMAVKNGIVLDVEHVRAFIERQRAATPGGGEVVMARVHRVGETNDEPSQLR